MKLAGHKRPTPPAADPPPAPPVPGEVPSRDADRADWVDYAVSKGGDRDEIEELQVSKLDLITIWGPRK